MCVVTEYIAKSCCFDPELNRWSPAPWTKLESNPEFMKLDDSSFKIYDVLVVRNEICFIVADRPSFVLWRYNIDLNTVTQVLFDWTKRASFCAVVVDRHIYVIGGTTLYCLSDLVDDVNKYIKQALSESARFDTAGNTRQEIAPLKEARSYAFGVSKTDENKIFIAGGFGIFRDWLKSCEVYNILTDEWHFIESLTVPRAYGKMVLIDEIIYVLGGSSKKPLVDTCLMFPHGQVTMESYDHERDKWNERAIISSKKITFEELPRPSSTK